MVNIMITNYNGKDDVMVFTENLKAWQIEAALRYKGQSFDDIYEVSDEDLQYYIYEPLWESESFVKNVEECCRKAYLEKVEKTGIDSRTLSAEVLSYDMMKSVLCGEARPA